MVVLKNKTKQNKKQKQEHVGEVVLKARTLLDCTQPQPQNKFPAETT